MRIWDVSPGYLNRQSLLGEHRELHGIVSIITHQKKGYSKHPETIRWINHGWAIMKRHQLLSAEMELRGYTDRSPVDLNSNSGLWPDNFIDSPFHQYEILNEKYQNKQQGRIPLPNSAQEIWRHHKYSVMARSINHYKEIGHKVASLSPHEDFSPLADQLAIILRQPPTAGGIMNSLLHMWGYISGHVSSEEKRQVENWSQRKILKKIQILVNEYQVNYLYESTALSELMVWIKTETD